MDSLDIAVVVEGVETDDQLSFLADCAPSSLIQGFLLSRPIPDAELKALWRATIPMDRFAVPPAPVPDRVPAHCL